MLHCTREKVSDSDDLVNRGSDIVLSLVFFAPVVRHPDLVKERAVLQSPAISPPFFPVALMENRLSLFFDWRFGRRAACLLRLEIEDEWCNGLSGLFLQRLCRNDVLDFRFVPLLPGRRRIYRKDLHDFSLRTIIKHF